MKTSKAWDQAAQEAECRVRRWSDDELVVALSMAQACDEPLRRQLGLRKERQHVIVNGLRAAIVKYGGLTRRQHFMAREMCARLMTYLVLLERRDHLAERMGVGAA